MKGVSLELERLTNAVAAGVESLSALTAGLRDREATKAAVTRGMAVLDAQAAFGAIDPGTLTKDLRA